MTDNTHPVVVYTHAPCNDGQAAARAFTYYYRSQGPVTTVGTDPYCSSVQPHKAETIWFLDVCPTPDQVKTLIDKRCVINVVDHHIGNRAKIEEIRRLAGIGPVVVFEPTGAGSAVELVCRRVFNQCPLPLWTLISEADTYVFSIFTKEETRIIYYHLEERMNRDNNTDIWGELEKYSVHEIKQLAAQLRPMWMSWMTRELSQVTLRRGIWRILDTNHHVIVSDVSDWRLKGLIVDQVEAWLDSTLDFVLMATGPMDQDTTEWSVRRARPDGPDCHTAAQAYGGNGHAGAAGFKGSMSSVNILCVD